MTLHVQIRKTHYRTIPTSHVATERFSTLVVHLWNAVMTPPRDEMNVFAVCYWCIYEIQLIVIQIWPTRRRRAKNSLTTNLQPLAKNYSLHAEWFRSLSSARCGRACRCERVKWRLLPGTRSSASHQNFFLLLSLERCWDSEIPHKETSPSSTVLAWHGAEFRVVHCRVPKMLSI